MFVLARLGAELSIKMAYYYMHVARAAATCFRIKLVKMGLLWHTWGVQIPFQKKRSHIGC